MIFFTPLSHFSTFLLHGKRVKVTFRAFSSEKTKTRENEEYITGFCVGMICTRFADFIFGKLNQ
jgi:hypothetical protein